MPYVSVYVDADDVLEELSADDLREALAKKTGSPSPASGKSELQLLEAIYLQQRDAGNATPEMREYIARTLGRIL